MSAVEHSASVDIASDGAGKKYISEYYNEAGGNNWFCGLGQVLQDDRSESSETYQFGKETTSTIFIITFFGNDKNGTGGKIMQKSWRRYNRVNESVKILNK